MKVKDIIAKKGSTVFTSPITISIKEALDNLIMNKVGSLVIVDDEKNPVGIITERDILNLANRDNNWHSLPVQGNLTTNFIVGIPEDHVEYIMSLMTINRIRHVPILDEGRLAGLISIGDIVKAQLKDIKAENRYLNDYIMGKYPA